MSRKLMLFVAIIVVLFLSACSETRVVTKTLPPEKIDSLFWGREIFSIDLRSSQIPNEVLAYWGDSAEETENLLDVTYEEGRYRISTSPIPAGDFYLKVMCYYLSDKLLVEIYEVEDHKKWGSDPKVRMVECQQQDLRW